MRLTAILLIVAIMHVSAKGLSQTITFSGSDVPLEKVFVEVKRQTGFVIFYDLDVVNKVGGITLSVKNMPLDSFLKTAFTGKPLSFTIHGKSIVVFAEKQTININQQQGSEPDPIKMICRVVDEDGNPLGGANIVIRMENGAVSTQADATGYFNVQGKAGQVVEVSFVGYKNSTFKIAKQNKSVNIVLTRTTSTMNEVFVNTGYQSILKERSAGSYVKVEGDAVKQKSVSMNIVDRLEGLVPGLAVNNSQGADKFLIRGVNSVNASRTPLYVVDGVPMDYDLISQLINPNDVENIVVLKDATAASIWGAQAANGVVVITTKKGKASGKIKVEYNGFASFKGLPDYSYQKMMSSQQFITAAKETFDPATYPYDQVTNINFNPFTLPVVLPHEQILYDLDNGTISQAVANQKLDSLASLNNRSQVEKNLMQPAFLTNHSVSLSGGNNFYSFYGSLSYTNQKNNYRTNTNSYMLNFKQVFSFTPNIKFDLTTNVAQQSSKQFIVPNLPTINTYIPYAMLADANGNPLSQSYLQLYDDYRRNAEAQSGVNLDYVPLKESSYTNNNNNTTLTARVNAGLSINFLQHFTYEGRYQYESGNNNNYTYYDQNSYYTRRELVNFTEPGPVYYLPSQGGDYFSGKGTNTAWTIRNQLTYSQNWTDNAITFLAGTEVRDNLYKTSNQLIRGYDYQTMTYTPYNELDLKNGIFNPVIPNYYTMSTLQGNTYSATETETRFFSLYSNFAYAYKRKYNLNTSLRMDQSNLFGADISKQYKPIWSVGASWNLGDESFFHKGFVNNMKLRLTYGIGGNSPNPGSGGPYDIIVPYPHPWYTNVGMPYAILRPANDKLTWESTATINAGVDICMLDNRITVSLDAYNKKTTNLLGNQLFDPTNGWFSGFTNLGDINNKGIELAIQSLNIKGKEFSWSTKFNISYNHNKVVRLSQVVPLTPSGKLYSNGFLEGYSAYSMFNLKWAGLDNLGDPQVYTSKGEKIKLIDNLQMEDIQYAGTTQPVYYGGMTNELRYKNWNLSFLLIYNLGYQMRRNVNINYYGRLVQNVQEYFNDRWKKPGDENVTNVPSYVADQNISNSRRTTDFYSMADINVQSSSYMKFRDITLSYNLPALWLHKTSISNCRIYGQVNNILLWTANDQHIDPEYYNLGGSGGDQNSGDGGTLRGAINSSLPDRMKPFYTIGLNVGFN